MSTHKTEVTVAGVTLSVTYEHFKGYRAPREADGSRAEPDESEHIERQTITSAEDITELLSDSILQLIEKKIMEGTK